VETNISKIKRRGIGDRIRTPSDSALLAGGAGLVRLALDACTNERTSSNP